MIETDIVVIGAGLSGLSALSYINNNNNNLKIVLFEARDRVGGRTCTIPVKEDQTLKIDIGGQWIGPTHTKCLDLIKKYNLKLEEQIYDDIDLEKNINQSTLICLINYSFNYLCDEDTLEINNFCGLIDKLGLDMNLNKPWLLKNAKEYDNQSVYDFVILNVKTKNAQDEILLFTQTVLSCDPNKLSFLFFIFHVSSSGGIVSLGDGDQGAQKFKIKNGSQQLSNLLLDELIDNSNNNILFSHPVKEILYDNNINDKDGYNIIVNSYSIETSSIVQIKCKRVILAMSPSLSIKSINFNPKLSNELNLLGDNLIHGNCIKIILVYKRAFWFDNNNNNNEKNCSIMDVVQKWPIHNLFHGSNSVENSYLVGLITGTAAENHSKLSYDERKELVLHQIEEMYNNSNIDDLIEYIEQDWSKEVYSGGCFADCFATGTFCNSGPLLRESIENLIFFSGVETAIDFYGYMEGNEIIYVLFLYFI
jgi:monoamine oxidase